MRPVKERRFLRRKPDEKDCDLHLIKNILIFEIQFKKPSVYTGINSIQIE